MTYRTVTFARVLRYAAHQINEEQPIISTIRSILKKKKGGEKDWIDWIRRSSSIPVNKFKENNVKKTGDNSGDMV